MDSFTYLLVTLQNLQFGPLVQTLVFLSTVFMFFGGALWLLSGDPVSRRLREVREGHADPEHKPYREGLFNVRWIQPIAKVLMPREDWRVSRLRRKLVLAGFRADTALPVFITSKAAFALLFAILASPLLFRSLHGLDARPVVLMVGAALTGFYLPDLYIYQHRKERQRILTEGFPDAMDLLVVCVEAGLGLDAAIARVGREMLASHPEFGAEMTLVSLEMRAGKAREEALRAFGERTGIEHIRALIALLVQAEHFGTSVATALREHAEEMRLMRLQAAKEKAAKLPVKLIFPIALFIFPALFLVILGPAVARIYLGLIAGSGG